ncbi:MAG: PD-(D/E)XK nuclease family protein [Muribaculaceae bacterium]|nr:PD-(D/E)XK nuclease family protein [Muribaculaceae bacterium]
MQAPHIQPFLERVAQAYLSQQDIPISECCFIFPNRRSGLFFRKYLGSILDKKSALLPCTTTITDWVLDMSGDAEANRIDQLFILYKAYRNIARERKMNISSFNQFIFWGDMIINDFNDIDKSLANARQIFSNLKNYNEIKSSYLTQEQRDLIEEFFGVSLDDAEDEYGNPVERFWLHTGDDENDSKGKFLKLWSVLFPLYEEFNKLLAKDGKSYQGAMFRKVAENLAEIDADTLPYKRYIFVGFNILTESERFIFRTLQKKGIADFYWDNNSRIIKEGKIDAIQFINRNRKLFPPLYPNFEEENTNKPNVNVISVSSNTGMVKIAADILKKLPKGSFIPSRDNALNTAIVIPDESLFLPVFSSINDAFDKVNITLGTPLRMFPITTLLTSIIALHRRTWNKDGEWHFFHEDVKNLLSNPFIASFDPDAVLSFTENLAKSKQKMVSINDLKRINPTLSPIFTKITSNATGSEALAYMDEVMKIVITLVMRHNSSEHTDNADNKQLSLDHGIIGRLQQILVQLHHTLNIYSEIDLKGETSLLLIHRLINSSTVALEGEPLNGLQVLGVLETRNLDFDNLIILSANEKTYPRRMFTRSMIPQNLRIGYNLPTNQHEESAGTYYFYRMLSRAKNVYLFYDNRNQIRSGGEESRYIYQLRYLYRQYINLNLQSYVMKVHTPKPAHIEIKKNERVMELLNRYRDSAENSPNRKYFSATALKKYLECPLQFYLQYVEELYPQEENEMEFIDSATFGSVLHDTMKELYYGVGETRDINRTLTAEQINSFIDSTKLDKILLKNINLLYYNVRNPKKAAEKEATGEALIIMAIMKKYITELLKYDAKRAPITLISAEAEEKGYWELAPGKGFNFRQFIDRLDRLADGTVRVIDYKTGKDGLASESIDFMFTPSEKLHSVQGMFQLMLYSFFHNYYEGNPDQPLRPIIYKIKDFFGKKRINSNDFVLKIGDDVLTNHLDYKEEFMQQLENLIDEIFDSEVPFRQSCHSGACAYCGFAEICRR